MYTVISSESGFFSLLIDGSTDASNSEDEIVFVMWSDVSSDDHVIYTRLTYHSMHTPLHTNAEGLFESLEQGLHLLGVPYA